MNDDDYTPKDLDPVELATSVAAVSFLLFNFLFINSHLCCSRGGGGGLAPFLFL